MAIVIPGWMEENFVNVENLLIDIFSGVFPDYESGCWAPDDWLDSQVDPDPMLMFIRLPGGHVDWDNRKDVCFVQALVITGSRDDSWALMNAVRSILLPFQGDKFKMGDGYTAQIHKAREVAGPTLLTPGQQLDTRVVSATFEVAVGMKAANNY